MTLDLFTNEELVPDEGGDSQDSSDEEEESINESMSEDHEEVYVIFIWLFAFFNLVSFWIVWIVIKFFTFVYGK